MPEEVGIDEQSLEILPTPKKKEKKPVKRERTGGSMTRGMERRNY